MSTGKNSGLMLAKKKKSGLMEGAVWTNGGGGYVKPSH